MATFTCYTLKLSTMGPLMLHVLMEYPTAVKLSKLHIFISVGRAHTYKKSKLLKDMNTMISSVENEML